MKLKKYVKGVRQKKRRKVFYKVSACSEGVLVSILGAGVQKKRYNQDVIKKKDALRKKKRLHS